MAQDNKTQFVLTAILLILNFNIDVIQCCSGGSSEETATKVPSATTPKDREYLLHIKQLCNYNYDINYR